MIKDITKETGWQRLLVEEASERVAKNGNTFVTLTLSDGEGRIEAKAWDTDASPFVVRGVMDINIRSQVFQDKESYIASDWRLVPIEEVDMSQYILSAPHPSEEMYGKIIWHLQNALKELFGDSWDVADEKCPRPLLAADMALAIYKAFKPQLLQWSAAKRMHHNMYGGLLWHTMRMVENAAAICQVYPELNKELLLAGAALHDIGKLCELETDELGTAEYTDWGKALGHIPLGIGVINSFRPQRYNNAEIKQLENMIASHHGKPEWGAAADTVTTEAVFLHLIDNMDAQAYIFNEARKEIEPGTFSKDKVFGAGVTGEKVWVYNPVPLSVVIDEYKQKKAALEAQQPAADA